MTLPSLPVVCLVPPIPQPTRPCWNVPDKHNAALPNTASHHWVHVTYPPKSPYHVAPSHHVPPPMTPGQNLRPFLYHGPVVSVGGADQRSDRVCTAIANLIPKLVAKRAVSMQLFVAFALRYARSVDEN
jgi:hypothetical protein